MTKNTFMKLSVCIITKNEEKDLPRCLESIKHLADEIIIIDDDSTDKTVEIAKKYGAKVFTRQLDNFAAQKNFAVEKATGDWIFAIDADEEATPELKDEIKHILNHSNNTGYKKDLRFKNYDLRKDDKGLQHKIGQINGYLIPRRNIILGAEIKHTRWSPDKHIWLWRNGKGKWVGDIHEEVEVEGWTGELANAKIHYHYETVAEFFAMLNNYTEREADQFVAHGRTFSYFQLFYAPLLSFFRRFIYKKGFLDGWRGFVLSYMMAIYRMTTWIKVWEKQQKAI
jgi:glycosyltransferase involved in cell wall biosynthesis